jgi:hypothetical protein
MLSMVIFTRGPPLGVRANPLPTLKADGGSTDVSSGSHFGQLPTSVMA